MRSLALIALVIVAGCSQPDADKLSQDAKNIANDAGKAASGLTLKGKVEAALRLRKDVNADNLHIDAKDGVVTITGHVKDPAERSSVYAVVSNTTGVDKVIDTDLKVDSLSK